MPRTYILLAALTPAIAQSDPPVVEDVTATKSGATWRFDVTLSHPDTGWDHYADGWRVLDENGNVLGTRTLYHPHVEEQPFTRSLSGVAVPEGSTHVLIEARDNVDGWMTETQFRLDLP